MLNKLVAVAVFSLICSFNSFSEEELANSLPKEASEKGCIDEFEYSEEDAKKDILEYELGLKEQIDSGEISEEEAEFRLEQLKNIDYDREDLCYYASFNPNKITETP
ncbi:MAG TPA: hypothetical protein DCL21_03675 [Alphaproteobacteria bacterium]|nr:hypothetical protein [Alphaproteobacteria bacterium]